MDKLQPLVLFSDPRWQTCLESFLNDVSRQKSHDTIVDYRTNLRHFFDGRDPCAVDHEAIESFCRRLTIYKTLPCEGTVKRRRAVIRDFYDLAIKNGIYQGAHPVRPPVVDNAAVFADPNWQTCYEHFMEDLYRRSQSSATVASYAGNLRRFFKDKADPANVTRSDVSQFINQPRGGHGAQGKSAAIGTQNVRISTIRSFYTFASGYTVAGSDGKPTPLFNRSNPTAGIRPGRARQAYKSLSLPEIKNFFACIPTDSIMGLRDRSWAWALLLTCRRRSELAALRWGSIEYGMITDEQGNSHEGFLYHFRGKGRQAIDDVAELPAKAMEEIKIFLEACGRWDTMTPESPIWACIGPESGGGNVGSSEIRALSAKGMALRLKIYARAAGIPGERFSMHSLRHTGAYLRKISGENLFDISRALRHKSLDMTKRYLEGLTIATADNGASAVSARLAQLGVT